jgi:peptide/nickel transport system substrate-binding protein
VVTDPNEIVSVAIRNPYYFAVDSEGRQLPYLDTVESEEQPRRPTRNLKLTSGNVDFQVRDINFSDFTILKQNERRGNYRVLLWAYDYVGEVVFYFPQPRADEEMARLQDDPRFRHALSYAINRQEIIEVVFRGLGEPAQVSVPLGSPFYNERHARTAVEYRPELANRLLDEMGLNRRAADGTRLLWSGRPLILVVAVDETRSLDAVQMVCNYWQAVGVNAQMKVQTMVLINNWNAMGLLDVGVAREGGNFFGPVVASNYAPTHPAECVWASKWTEWLVSAGQRGWEPPERFKRLEVLWRRVVEAPTREAMIAAWQALSEHTAEQLPTIGITTPPGAVVYVRNGFKNVPELSLAGWIAHDPGNNCPEVFFWENGGD